MKQHKKLLVLFTLFSLVYLALILFIPAEARSLNRYNISGTEAKLISLSFAIPYMLIWFTALYSYSKFKNYATSIINSKEGVGFSKIADGLLALAIWMPVSAIFSNNFVTYVSRSNPDLRPIMTILSNYVNIIIIFIAFLLLYQGAKHLISTVYTKKIATEDNNFFPEIFLIASGLFAYFTFANPARTNPTETIPLATYYLPDWLILLTIVIPYICIWFLGLTAASMIQSYRLNVSGILYRSSLQYLASGVISVIVTLITLRYLVSMTSFFSDTTLRIILAIVYLLLILIAIGYILIAIGARKLKKIEEI